MPTEVRPEPRAEQQGFHWGPRSALVFLDHFSVNPIGRWNLNPRSKGGFARAGLGKVLTQLVASEGSSKRVSCWGYLLGLWTPGCTIYVRDRPGAGVFPTLLPSSQPFLRQSWPMQPGSRDPVYITHKVLKPT